LPFQHNASVNGSLPFTFTGFAHQKDVKGRTQAEGSQFTKATRAGAEGMAIKRERE